MVEPTSQREATDSRGAPMIEADRLGVTLAGREIVRDVSIRVGGGRVFGFIGPNGAGKTTVIRALLGLRRPASGAARILGHDAWTAAARAARGFVLDQDGLYADLTAAENVAFFRELCGLRADPGAVAGALADVGLSDRAHDPVGEFSRGMRARVAIARAIAHHPSALILDEPTAGLDPIAAALVHDVVEGLARDRGVAVLLSSHDLGEVSRLCDEVALIADGRVVMAGPPDELARAAGAGRLSIQARGQIRADARARLRSDAWLGVREVAGDRLVVCPPKDAPVSQVVARLAEAGLEIVSLQAGASGLEQAFAQAVAESAERRGAEPDGERPSKRKARRQTAGSPR